MKQIPQIIDQLCFQLPLAVFSCRSCHPDESVDVAVQVVADADEVLAGETCAGHARHPCQFRKIMVWVLWKVVLASIDEGDLEEQR